MESPTNDPCPEATVPSDQERTAKPRVPAWHLHRRLYDWILHWADTPYGGWALFVMSLAESSFFPVPPDVLLAPLVLGNRRKWVGFATMCSVASIIGGILGYGIGMFLWVGVGNFFHDRVPGFDRDQVVMADGRELAGMIDGENVVVKPPMMKAEVTYPATLTTRDGEKVSLAAQEVTTAHVRPFTKVGALYKEYNFWIVAAAGFTPLPYKVITISAGVFKINFLIFCIASAASRSARFFLVAGLMGILGPRIAPLIDKYFNLLCVLFTVLLIGGFAVIKYAG